MDNKPIMIDGVDVTGCADYDEDTYFTCQACGVCKCSELPNCYFKQLAHKTQECEELKLQLTSLSYADTICALEIDLKHKTQECEQSEQKLEQIKNICHRKADGLWSQTNPLKEILQIIDEVK